jgi:hypothetical protein
MNTQRPALQGLSAPRRSKPVHALPFPQRGEYGIRVKHTSKMTGTFKHMWTEMLSRKSIKSITVGAVVKT